MQPPPPHLFFVCLFFVYTKRFSVLKYTRTSSFIVHVVVVGVHDCLTTCESFFYNMLQTSFLTESPTSASTAFIKLWWQWKSKKALPQGHTQLYTHNSCAGKKRLMYEASNASCTGRAIDRQADKRTALNITRQWPECSESLLETLYLIRGR